MTSTQNMTLTSLPAFTTPAVKVVLGTIIVACALAGLPILFVTINYLRNAVQSHGQAINRCDAKYTFLLSLIGPELVWILRPRPHVGFRIELISHTTYREGRPIGREVLKMRIWAVLPSCLGSR